MWWEIVCFVRTCEGFIIIQKVFLNVLLEA